MGAEKYQTTRPNEELGTKRTIVVDQEITRPRPGKYRLSRNQKPEVCTHTLTEALKQAFVQHPKSQARQRMLLQAQRAAPLPFDGPGVGAEHAEPSAVLHQVSHLCRSARGTWTGEHGRIKRQAATPPSLSRTKRHATDMTHH